MAKKILVVDDHPAYSSVLGAALESQGFRVVVSMDPAKAVDLAEAEKPDLVLLDIMMPHMGGREVHAALLKNPATQHIPAIYLTGLRPPRYSRPKDGSKKAPAVRTVGKSDDLKELLEAIREALGG